MKRRMSKNLLRYQAKAARIVPAGFLLAQVRGEAVSGVLGRTAWAGLVFGLVTALPLLWMAVRRRPEQGDQDCH